MNERKALLGPRASPETAPQPAAMGRRFLRWRPHRIRLPEVHLGFSERKMLLFTGDVLLLNLALLLGMALAPRLSVTPAVTTVVRNPLWFLTLTGLWCLAAMVLNCYDLETCASPFNGPLAGLTVLLVVAVAYFFVPYWSAPLPGTRLAWLLFLALAAAGLATWRFTYAVLFVQPGFRRRTLIVGAGRSGRTILSVIQAGYQADYELVGFIDDDPAKAGSAVDGVPVVGTRADLVRLVHERAIDKVILAITRIDEIHDELFQALLDCHELGAQVTSMIGQYEKLTGRVPLAHIGLHVHHLLPAERDIVCCFYLLLRRGLDLVAALLGLAGLALLLPAIAIISRLDSPGPLFYSQPRVGKGGRLFRVYKFRTMVTGAEGLAGAVWARKNDRRVTRFGRWARRLRLDELPQFWNVLRGQMSVIGPRPERPELVRQLEEQIPFYRIRHAIKPGITGWAQVNHRYANSIPDTLVKLQYDLYYVKYRSFYLDLLITCRSIATVLSFSGI